MLLLAGCSKVQETDIPVAATIAIEKIGSDAVNGFNVRFTPSEDAASFEYAITETGTMEDFASGNISETVHVDGNSQTEAAFSELNTNTVYTIFARAYDESGKPGAVAQYRAMTGDGFFKVEIQYVSDVALGIVFDIANDYYNSEYYLGTPADRDAFMAGTLETSSTGDMFSTRLVKNYFDLKPSTEYVFYVKGYNRANGVEYRELPVKTFAEGECPKASFEVVSTDIYKSKYRLTANEYAGKIVALPGKAGSYEAVMDINWSGDIAGMLDTWANTGWAGTVYSVSGSLDVEYVTNDLLLDNAIDIWVVVYDKEMLPADVQKIETSTPSFDPEAKGGSVSIEVTDITSKGAKYIYTAEEDNFAFMYDTVEADWYDDIKENSSDWYEYYLSDIFFRQGFYFAYTADLPALKCQFEEKNGTPSTRYYAAAAPMNPNGPREGGWLPVVLKEYVTSAE